MLRKVTKSMLAVFLIFFLTIADFAVVTKSYASTFLNSVFNGNSSTGSKNVEFDAYFVEAEKEKSYSVISSVCENVALELSVFVFNEGYLKNAQIAIKPYENGELNFIIDSEINNNYNNYVKNFENNILDLKQINKNSGLTTKLQLSFNEQEFIKLKKLDSSFIVEFKGTYINSSGDEIEVRKTVNLNLEWKDKREINISSEITKYIPFNTEKTNRCSTPNFSIS